jgi:proteasome accessory factor C
MTAARHGPRGAEDRVRRLLVMLPWLMERGEVSVAETARRFDLSERDVARDLELVAMCGLPPFVDELVDVFIDEGTIFVGVPRLFTRPLRLNAVEAWELLAAGRAAMELPGADADGPLGRGLAKLATALGDDDTAGVRIDLDRPEAATSLAEAAETGRQVRIEYWSPARDEITERLILPRQVFTDRGEWYVTADDDRSGEVRIFRIDRIETLEPTGATPSPSDTPLPVPGDWFTDGSIPRVTVRLAPAARWVVERYPVDSVDGPDEAGWVTATLPIASERWFTRTLVRLGANAEIIEPDEWGGTARAAVERVLDRYRRS